MPKIRKKTSKRVSTKQRVKVQKKVREHQRKSRRDAKKDTTWRSKKRVDPGIPNSFPYKEQLLNEIEQRRMKAEQDKIAAREARKNGDEDDATAADEDMADEVAIAANAAAESAKAASTQVLAQSEKYMGTLSDFMTEPDLAAVVFLLDARDPDTWRVPQVEIALAKRKCPIVYGLSRADLIPREPLATWIAHLESTTKHKAFALCSPAPAGNGRQARKGAGIDALVAQLEIHTKKTAAKKATTKASVAVLGIENSGRTQLASILAASLPDICIYDTPALLPATSKLANLSSEEEAAASKYEEAEEDSDEAMQQRDRDATHRMLVRNAGGIFKVREPLPLIEALMRRVAQESDLMMAFNTPAFVDINDFLISVARASGRLKKHAVPDTTAAARNILFAWSHGQIGYYAQPPSSTPALKQSAEQVRKRFEDDKGLSKVVMPRKDWRAIWSSKELRLNANPTSMLGDEKVPIAFAKAAVAVQSGTASDEDEEDDEDEDMDDEDLEEEFDEDDLDEDDEEDDEEEDE